MPMCLVQSHTLYFAWNFEKDCTELALYLRETGDGRPA